MKDAQDYINLYVGQTVRIIVTSERSIDLILVGTNFEQDYFQVNLKAEKTGLCMWYRWDKSMYLLLRKKDALTHAEQVTWKKFISTDTMIQEAEATRYLLKRGIDLYGLIELKLAIDKNKTI